MTLPHIAMLLARATGCDIRALLTWANLRQQRARDRFLARRNGKTLQESVHRIVRITAWQMTGLDSGSTRGPREDIGKSYVVEKDEAEENWVP
jgi:hypothetical protein